MRAVAVVNEKGGVGKTLLALQVAGCLAGRKIRTLVVDHDPQHSLTSALLGSEAAIGLDVTRTAVAIYDDKQDASPARLIRSTRVEGLSLVPGSRTLGQYNRFGIDSHGDLRLALRHWLGLPELAGYLVLVDNPPNLQLCTFAALAACQAAVI